ncbi:MAG TPA: tetraacyldisaccharide 4'-kinase, partial [Desulfobaccales bacterium]|nr:tetraacyldisaccharide 4'-kinase [Desulfobaccales bacterium]
YAAGMTAWEEFQPDLFLLDDGFQHFQLHRDLDLVLLDAAAPFGNGFLLPRGPLREPRVALEAAEVIILTRFAPERHQAQLDALHRDFPHKTILTAGIDPVRVTSYPGGHAEGLEAMRHRALVAFAGLARPGVFTSTLQEMGVDVKDFWAFPDHHVYRRQEIRDLADQARTLGAGALITTGKDWARLGEHWEGNVLLWVLEVEARLREAEGLLALLDRILKK